MGLSLLFYPLDLPAQSTETALAKKVQVRILGITQDAGYPQIGCKAKCCEMAWLDPATRRSPVCLAIVDQQYQMSWMIEATPDLRDQWQKLEHVTGWQPEGILITHAHAGHYTGLMQLGKEMMNARKMPVMVLPRMAEYLRNNGPWSQLVSLQNIDIQTILPDSSYLLSDNVSYQALVVPHRDEFSETAAFMISGPSKKMLFVPDIDKWNKWRVDILQLIQEVDYALIDGTFFKNGELKNRDMSEIPHPFITESMELFGNLSPSDRKKVYFIHFNHTNPLVYGDPEAIQMVQNEGMNVALEGLVLTL